MTYVDPLRAALATADYTVDAVAEQLGPAAHGALSRNETTPGEHATRGGSPLDTLIRMWLLQLPVSAEDADRALPGLVDRLCRAGLLERSVSEVAARVDVRPYSVASAPDTAARDLWVAADLTPGLDGSASRVGPDHVLGISAAATSLTQLTVRRPVRRALDLGTGCGVQALHLTDHASEVVATDVNPRALWLAGLTTALNQTARRPVVDVREGSFFDPVREEAFDLIVSNPPFVISPATGEQLVYRDSGIPGDRAVEDLVRAAPGHLAVGGTCQLLANWLVLRDRPWSERLEEWVQGAVEPIEAWVVQRETSDLPSYVELWLKDAGVHPSTGGDAGEYHRRYDTWLRWFDQQGAEAVGYGWINLRRSTGEQATARLEDWPYEVALPLGDEVDRQLRVLADGRSLSADGLLAARPVRAADVVQETLGVPGAEDPHTILLRRQSGVRRARLVDTPEAALVGACDGDLTLAQLLGALADLGSPLPDPDATVRSLIDDGYLGLA